MWENRDKSTQGLWSTPGLFGRWVWDKQRMFYQRCHSLHPYATKHLVILYDNSDVYLITKCMTLTSASFTLHFINDLCHIYIISATAQIYHSRSNLCNCIVKFVVKDIFFCSYQDLLVFIHNIVTTWTNIRTQSRVILRSILFTYILLRSYAMLRFQSA